MAISKVLITGIAGSAGSYLAEYIDQHEARVEIHGLAGFRTPRDNLNAIKDRVIIHEGDLMDFASLLTILERVKPDGIFHLAAYANVRASFTAPSTILRNNILGTSNLFEAIKMSGQDPLIQLCSTSEVYGQAEAKDIPIKEDAPFRPASPYAVSKVAQDMLGWTYFSAYKMRIVRTRMFAYINPRRPDLFATSFAKQIAWIERGLQTELAHGNLDSVRTFLDVKDAMRAYWLALLHCNPGEVYNIGSTHAMTVGEVLERLIALSNVPIPRRLAPELLRPADLTLQVPCIDKFIAATGWKSEYDFDESLQDLMAFWRKQAAKTSLSDCN
jgi:GDP-4-dehydro-6-deoxy-D-mannose reductase